MIDKDFQEKRESLKKKTARTFFVSTPKWKAKISKNNSFLKWC